MENYCNRHLQEQALDNWSLFSPTSRLFLEQLGLPALHPFCNASSHAIIHPSAPEMGPPTEPFDDNLVEALITLWYYYVPPSVALFLVWFFLFAGYIAPSGTTLLLWFRKRTKSRSLVDYHPCLVALTLVSSWIVMTDDQYLFEFNRAYGMMLLGVSLTAVGATRKDVPKLVALLCVCCIISPWKWEDPNSIPTTVKAGLYYNVNNTLIRNMVTKWQANLPEYSQVATPFWMTGEARTGMPYTFGYVADPPRFHRVWLPTFDNEFVAMDISFPRENGHNWKKPLYLVFHGLNGGSKEGYVVDFCSERNKEGSTCVVLIARGLGDTPIQGWTVSTCSLVAEYLL
jgi:hypothetical protein